MNITKLIMVGSFMGLCLAACTNEDFSTTDSPQGTMSLSVSKKDPSATRAVNTADFPVAIYSANDNKVFASYDKASSVPSKILMPVGSYYAEAHTPGDIKKIMDAPYYAGCDSFQILQNINTISKVICRMVNGSFTVRFSEDFSDVFQSWTVSIDDGTATAIVYATEDGLNPPTKYMRYESNVEVLNVNFRGTTKKGDVVTANYQLSKKQADQQYESDSPYFEGGDCIKIELYPTDATEGEIIGVTLKANIKFDDNESNEDITIEIGDNLPDTPGGDTPGGDTPGGDTPGGDTPGTGDSNVITLDLPADMVVAFTTDPALGNTYIAAENGLKSIRVKVSSTSQEMIESLADIENNYEGVNFVEGAEVVGNENMVLLFSDLSQTLNVPSEGDTEYTFPIGNFFTLLMFLPGEHTFDLIVTDMQGNTKSGKLKLTVEEE